jgi:S-adenosyl-L-methionine hydrolase (adenosine-forming)
MTTSGILTLLSDFGDRDVYVGVMKGAIAQINPALTVVDLTHHIPPQNLMAARFNLMNAFPYFPQGTVHVAVVDPGVGSQRRAIAIELPQGFLVGPDNGIFSGILEHYPAIAAVELDNVQYWRSPTPSSTFHGRDIFAPVGAHLASGCRLNDVGRAIAPTSLVHLPLAPLEQTATGFVGCLQYIDHFGNLVTNIPGHLVQHHSWSVTVGATQIASHTTYAAVASGDLLALVGSHGWVEIAVSNGSAKEQLQIHPVQLQPSEPIYVDLGS